MTASQPFTTTLISSNRKMFKYCWVWHKPQARGHLNAWHRPMTDTEDVVVFCDGKTTYNPQIADKPVKNQRPVTPRKKKSDCYGEYDATTFKLPPDKSMPKTVIRFNGAQKTNHPTQKPVALMEYMIKTYTNEGETVLDFTMGSGTTGIAALNTGRKFIGIELDQEYFDIACNRIAQHKQPFSK